MAPSVVLFSVVCCGLLVWLSGADAMPEYYKNLRNSLIATDKSMETGHDIRLNEYEKRIDQLLKDDKLKIIEAARLQGGFFPASHNFLRQDVRLAMENTTSFKIIKRMPKGGILHSHKTAMVSMEWVIRNVTYRPNLYFCVLNQQKIRFKFADPAPNSTDDCEWLLMSVYRQKTCSDSQLCLDAFDGTIFRNLSIVTEHPEDAYPDIDSVWDKFEMFFDAIDGLLDYAPVWRDYTWRMMEEMIEDGVQYIEIRGGLPILYELDGTVHEKMWSVYNVYDPVIKQFQQLYPKFIDIKFIQTKFRGSTPEKVLGYVKEAMEMYRLRSDFVVGFDLVGQEDPFNPLLDFIDALLYPLYQDPPVHLPYFFHAGETAWQRTASDLNLVDALILNATRIGHGYALHKHPMLMELVKSCNVPVEVNPLSNQVLNLVADLRNHPAAILLSRDFPVVISSDDPSIWNALPLTHDFYVTFMALIAEDAGLAELKKLALNSIKYSSMKPREKWVAMSKWQTEWTDFILEAGKCLQPDLCPEEILQNRLSRAGASGESGQNSGFFDIFG